MRARSARPDFWRRLEQLALAYAVTHREHVSAMILRGIFTLRRMEIDWFYRFGASMFFPEKWQAFMADLTPEGRADPVMTYYARLTGADEADRVRAAVAWSVWEGETSTLLPEGPPTRNAEESFALAFSRIENHYFVHGGWMAEGELLTRAASLNSIPGVIIQGRYDMVCPPITAWELSQRWTTAELQMVEDSGHSFAEPGTLHRLMVATDHFAGLV